MQPIVLLMVLAVAESQVRYYCCLVKHAELIINKVQCSTLETLIGWFNCLPVAALIDDKILCMHSGLSPELTNLDQIRKLSHPTDVSDSSLLCGLLWPHPSRDSKVWPMNDGGVSHTFGPDKVSGSLKKHDMDLICHAHQVVEDGYEFFADRYLVTTFSH